MVRGLLRVPRSRLCRHCCVSLCPVDAKEILPRAGGNDEGHYQLSVCSLKIAADRAAQGVVVWLSYRALSAEGFLEKV